jgi:hypothetical protein
MERSTPRRRAAFAAWVLSVCAAAAPASDPAARVRDASAAVARHSDGFYLDDDPRSPRLVERLWQSLSDWSAAELARQPGFPQRLKAASARLGQNLAMKALPLGGGRYLVGGGRSFGTAFILVPGPRGLAGAWSIAGAAGAASRGRAAALAAWRADKAVSGCRSDQDACGPMQVDDLGLLPADSEGRPRFWILGTRVTAAGATVGGQLSLWRWNGRAAEPLVVQGFAYSIEQEAPVITVAGASIRLRGKGAFDHLVACGSCEGRPVEWRFSAGPQGVRSEGGTSLAPELDFIDRLLGLALKGVPPSLATPGAANDLRALARTLLSDSGKEPYYGMIAAWKVTARGARRELCLGTDAFTRLFTLEGSAPPFRLAESKPLPDGACTGRGSRS